VLPGLIETSVGLKPLGPDPVFPKPVTAGLKEAEKVLEAEKIVENAVAPPGAKAVPFAPPMILNALSFSVVFLTQFRGAFVFLNIVTDGLDGVSPDPPRKLGIELHPLRVSDVRIAISVLGRYDHVDIEYSDVNRTGD
jgi:hypothetical protein